jgi:pyrimidine deaminase RibD-like protein
MRKALEVASRSRCRYKHGCIVVSRGQIVSEATNRKIGDPEIAWRIAHLHAEVAALLAAGPLANGSTLYVARISASGKPAESKPCKKCDSFIEKYGVTRVVWT